MKKLLKVFPEDYKIIMSLGNPNSRSKPIKNGHAIIYDWLPNRFEILKACDVVISRASLGTLTQAICYGKPLILIPTPSQTEQMNNAKRAKELGVAKILNQKKLNYEQLSSAVNEILTSNYHKQKAERIKEKVSDYNAIETVVNIITNLHTARNL
jgi:UDP:flavonoid glycosyltransferase YjiC (YdhE family)